MPTSRLSTSTLLDSRFRHRQAVRNAITTCLRAYRRNPTELAAVVKNKAWVWDLCLQDEIIRLSTLEELLSHGLRMTISLMYEGNWSSVSDQDPPCTASHLLNVLGAEPRDAPERAAAVRNVDDFRTVIGHPSNLVGLIQNPFVPPRFLRGVEGIAAGASRALTACVLDEPRTLSGALFLTLVLVELIIEKARPTDYPSADVVGQLIQLRTAHNDAIPERWKRLLSHEDDRSFLAQWCGNSVSIFQWVDESAEVGGAQG
jgi:hypothetical protein